VIDSQVHIFARENLPDGNREEFARRAARARLPYRDHKEIVPRVGRGTWDGEAEALIEFLDAAEVELGVNATCDFGPCFGEEAEWDGLRIHEHAYEMTQRHRGRVAFVCGVDPRRHDALDILDRSVKEWGAVGWQCFPANGYEPTDPLCLRLFERCLQLGVPAVIRTGSGDIGPYTAYSHPYYVEEIAQLGLWQGSALFGSPRAPDRIAEFLRILHTMREQVGAHRLLWGSDYMRGFDTAASVRWAQLFRDLPAIAREHGFLFNDDEVELMTDANARRLFGLPAGAAAASTGAEAAAAR
jgi:predicted TIM-barrel fold metal-dependent hydrolase